MTGSRDIIAAIQAEADALRSQPGAEATIAAMAKERDVLIAALRRAQGYGAYASRDSALMRQMALLDGIIGGYERSDEATIIRALAESAGIRRETLLAAGQTRRRKADALAHQVATLAAEGLTANQIAVKVHRSESSVRRLLARAGGR